VEPFTTRYQVANRQLAKKIQHVCIISPIKNLRNCQLCALIAFQNNGPIGNKKSPPPPPGPIETNKMRQIVESSEQKFCMHHISNKLNISHHAFTLIGGEMKIDDSSSDAHIESSKTNRGS
jgi:hypothetical protein